MESVGHRTLSQAYPVLGLRVQAGPIELAGMDDDTLIALANLAADGIHQPDRMPFLMPWTQAPAEMFHRQFLQHHWRVRAAFSEQDWNLDLAVRHDGELVGTQGVSTHSFLATRTGETGSWLSQRFQGRGIGKLMRQTLCAFLFDHLDFDQITSSAFDDNHASNGVSRAVGYRPNGVDRKPRGDGWVSAQNYLLTPENLVRGPALTVDGLAPLRRLIGLDTAG